MSVESIFVEKTKTSALYNLASAAFAFSLWGGWSYYVNQNITSALTQGVASFLITLLLVHAVTWLYFKMSSVLHDALKILLPAIISVSFTGSSLYLIHTAIKTTHIAKTITPALLVAFVFCMLTAYKLQGQEDD